MFDEYTNERLVSLLNDRFEKINEELLEQIGKTIKKIGSLTPTQAHQLEYILKYGGNYDNIVKKLEKLSLKSGVDIDKIFKQVAKNNQEFDELFYEYRNIKQIPYEQNIALQNQVNAIANITKRSMFNIASTTGFVIDKQFKPLDQTYYDLIDEAILKLSQGKDTYQDAMRDTLKKLADSGIRTRITRDGIDTGERIVDYENGYTRRLDSAIRMNLLDGIREVSNETQREFAKEFNYDGIEISVHINPAKDHEKVQGHQFSVVRPSENELSEWEKLQNGLIATDYNGERLSLDHDGNGDYRKISTLNCYHYEFPIILGVSKPLYTKEELNDINKNNHKGFIYEDKHYTNYEGTQLMRNIETEIRKQKDRNIIANASGDTEMATESEKRIRLLRKRYKEISQISGLKEDIKRARVSSYKRQSIAK